MASDAVCRRSGWLFRPFVVQTLGAWGGGARFRTQRLVKQWYFNRNAVCVRLAMSFSRFWVLQFCELWRGSWSEVFRRALSRTHQPSDIWRFERRQAAAAGCTGLRLWIFRCSPTPTHTIHTHQGTNAPHSTDRHTHIQDCNDICHVTYVMT